MVAKTMGQAKLPHHRTADEAAIIFCCALRSPLRRQSRGLERSVRCSTKERHSPRQTQEVPAPCQQATNKQPLRQPDRVRSKAQVERLLSHLSTGNDLPIPA